MEKGLCFLNMLSTTFLMVMFIYPDLDAILLVFVKYTENSNYECL